jgi:hypothetical protein
MEIAKENMAVMDKSSSSSHLNPLLDLPGLGSHQMPISTTQDHEDEDDKFEPWKQRLEGSYRYLEIGFGTSGRYRVRSIVNLDPVFRDKLKICWGLRKGSYFQDGMNMLCC